MVFHLAKIVERLIPSDLMQKKEKDGRVQGLERNGRGEDVLVRAAEGGINIAAGIPVIRPDDMRGRGACCHLDVVTHEDEGGAKVCPFHNVRVEGDTGHSDAG